MPWTQTLARHMVDAQNAGLISSGEYEVVRSALQLNEKLVDHASATTINGAQEQAKANGMRYDSGFKFGAGSMKELKGVNSTLVSVATLALRYSTQDFVVYDGIRTIKEQTAHVKAGTSKTMQSKHLDGLAVDLVPYINGKPTWDWDGCCRIAMAMDKAASELGVAHKIRWGGAWDRTLADFGDNADSYRKEVEAYKARHPGPDFLDGPHFEWIA